MIKMKHVVLLTVFLLLLLPLEHGSTFGANVWSSGPFSLRFGSSRDFYMPEMREGNYQLWIRASNPEVCAMFNGSETKSPTPGRFLPGGFRNISARVVGGGGNNFGIYQGNRVSGGKVKVCYGCCRKTIYGQRYPDASIEVGISKN